MLLIYRGPAQRIRSAPDQPDVRPGGEIELTRAQAEALMRAGHRFDVPEKSQNSRSSDPDESRREEVEAQNHEITASESPSQEMMESASSDDPGSQRRARRSA